MDLSNSMGSFLVYGFMEITLMFPKVNLLEKYRRNNDMKTANSSLDISFSFLEGLFILTQEISSEIRNNPY